MVEGCTELVELLLSDTLAVAGQDLVLHLVDRSKIKTLISSSLSVSLCDSNSAAANFKADRDGECCPGLAPGQLLLLLLLLLL